MTGRVLILDDDPNVGQTIALMAEAADVEARWVSDPDAFFRTVEEWQPTHIVLDLVMPEMDGVEVLHHLADGDVSASIMILSGVGSRVLDAARRIATEKGLIINHVLAKPVTPAALNSFFADYPANAAKNGVKKPSPSKRGEVTEGDLREGINREQFQLVYQPKIDCATRELAGYEALVRWHHPVRGVTLPEEFIPLAEARNLIEALTLQIINAALQDMLAMADMPRLSLAINLSSQTLNNLQFADDLAERCRTFDVDLGRLTLEMTETAATGDPALALDLVTRLRMKGFQVSIDDVGTGYSSLAQLARLPFSEMKIDKSFVTNALASADARSIITSFIDLGHRLGLRVVAEGVEDEATLRFLEELGCDYAQGFHIAHPMPSDAAIHWALTHQRARF